MQTKYTISTGKAWFYALLIWAGILALAILAAGCSPQNNPTPPAPTQIEQRISAGVSVQRVAESKAEIRPRIGGDCLADRYTGDVWKRYDWYCQPDEGSGNSVVEVLAEATRKAKERIVATLTAIVTPTNTPTASPTKETTPVPTITGTPSPTQETPTATPTVSKTPKPSKTPTNTHTAEPTVNPTNTATPEPTETSAPECKNKNSGKDGTPAECNAGIGQEKKN